MSDATLTVVQTLTVTIDGTKVTVPAGTTLYDAAQGAGIDLPVLCHSPRLQPVAVCRMCVVEVKGARVLQAACIRQAEEGMVVHTQSDKVQKSRRMLTELLLADYPKADNGQAAHALPYTGKRNLLLTWPPSKALQHHAFRPGPLIMGRICPRR